MMYGGSALSETSISQIRDADSQAIPGRFYDVLGDDHAERVYIFEAHPYDSATDTIKDVYIATRTLNTESGDSVSNTHIPGALLSPLNIKQKLFVDRRLMGEASIDAGAVVILNDNGDFDYFLDYDWGGREAKLLLGAPDFSFDEYHEVWVGKTEQITGNYQQWSIRLRSLKEELKQPIQDNHYAGTGTDEGTENLDGTEKPLCYGYCYNITPTLVNPTLYRYQIHDGRIDSILAVYIGGVQATLGVDYSTDVVNGFIDLVSAPTGEVTCDVIGGVDSNNYPVTKPDRIIQEIFKTKGGYSDSDMALSTFGNFDSNDSYDVGVFIPAGAGATFAQIFSDIATSFGGYWGISALNKLFVGVVGPDASLARTISQDDVLKMDIDISAPITYKTRVGWKRSWTVQSRGNLAAAATEAYVDFVGNEFRWSTDEDTALRADYPLSEERDIQANYNLEAGAIAEASRQQNLFGVERKIIKLELQNLLYDMCLCKGINLIDRLHPSGIRMMIISVNFDVKNNKTVVEVWG